MKTHQKNNERLATRVFQEVFHKYDLMNDLMSMGIHRIWKRNFIDWLNPQKETRLIDVASGTGDIANLFLKKTKNESNVYCVDENQDMLEVSKKRFKKEQKIKWFCCNAEQLPFQNNYFDYYTISFGIRNFSNINNSLKEAYRVLKPGGRFLCLEFSKVRNEILNKFYKTYSKSIPIIGKFVVGNAEPYKYLVNSIENFYNQDELFEKIKKQKFENISYRNLNGGIVAIHSAWKI